MLATGAQAMVLDAAVEASDMSRRTAERLFVKETGSSPARSYRLVRLARWSIWWPAGVSTMQRRSRAVRARRVVQPVTPPIRLRTIGAGT